MMFEEKAIYNDIPLDLFANKDSFVFKKDKSIYYLNDNCREVKSFIENFVLEEVNENILIRTRTGLQLLGSNLELIAEGKFKYGGLKQVKGVLGSDVLVREEINDSWFLTQYSLTEGAKWQIKAEEELLVKIISEYHFITYKNGCLYSYRSESNNYDWCLNIAEMVKWNAIELYKNKIEAIGWNVFLFVHSNSWDNFFLLIIDSRNGSVLKSISDFGPEFFVHQDKIYALGRGSRVVKVMDPVTFEISEIDMSKELDSFVFETECQSFFYQNELFVALKKESSDIYNYWGVIDLESFKLVHLQEMLLDESRGSIEGNEVFVSGIMANSGMVAVRTQGNILHVYKR